jgi:hypothetical protein
MRIGFNSSALKELKWHEAIVRFALGAFITAAAGAIATIFGPSVGGLFLAFPAILPATLTLVAGHQEERKAALGLNGQVRGAQAAALDARGALMGGLGLLGFAITVRQFAAWGHPAATLAGASTVWFVIASVPWWLRKSTARRRILVGRLRHQREHTARR